MEPCPERIYQLRANNGRTNVRLGRYVAYASSECVSKAICVILHTHIWIKPNLIIAYLSLTNARAHQTK